MRTEVQKFYDEIHKKGWRGYMNKSELLRFQRILTQIGKYCPLDEINYVLDIGCRFGEFLKFLPFKHKYGVDISPFAVKKAKKSGIHAKVVNVENKKLPYEDNFFDMVFCMEILEHLFDASLLFSEVKRVLKPKGYLYITVPNDLFMLSRRLAILVGQDIFIKQGVRESGDVYKGPHIRFFKKSSLRDLVLKKGFKIIYVGGLPYRFFKGKYSLGLVGEFLATHFTDLLVNYTLLAQKP